jgi:hypothetical protein
MDTEKLRSLVYSVGTDDKGYLQSMAFDLIDKLYPIFEKMPIDKMSMAYIDLDEFINNLCEKDLSTELEDVLE